MPISDEMVGAAYRAWMEASAKHPAEAMRAALEAAEAELARVRATAKDKWHVQHTLLREQEAELARLRSPAGDVGEVVDRLRVLGQFYRICQTAADHLTRLAKERDECLNASADYLIDLTDVKARADRLAGLVKEATARVRDIENIALTSVGPGYRAIHQIVGGLLENLKEPTNE